MKKIVLLTFALILFSTAVVVRFISPVVSYSTETELQMEVGLPVHNIDSGKNFSTIQEAINDDETLDGHTIFVEAGTYYEHVNITRSISLIGENRSTTIIDGSSTGTVVYVTANNVSIAGFTVQNGRESISLFRCQYCSVNENRILGNERKGIGLLGSSNNRIESNFISNNFWGIHLMFDLPICGSKNNTVLNNVITNNKYGITFFSHSNCNKIIENTIVSNDDDGIFLSGSSSNTIHSNSVIDNKWGFAVSGGLKNTFSQNMILNCFYIGISMKYTNSSLVLGNVLNNSEIGLWARNINDCIFSGNTISMNNQGIQTLFSDNSTYYHNNLINNTMQVNSYNSTSIWDNGKEGNYWSNYNGTDNDGDGIGDTPYVINENNQDNYPLMNPVVIPEFPDEENPTPTTEPPPTETPPEETPTEPPPNGSTGLDPTPLIIAVPIVLAIILGVVFYRKRKH